MTDHDYQHIEELLTRLLGLLASLFSKEELIEVQDFIDVGEYGVALETLVAIVDEEEKRISNEVLLLIYEIADAMLIDKSVFEGKLRGHVIGEQHSTPTTPAR